MKLIQKKCPNCGANLEFDKEDKEVNCKYCNTTFLIDKDDNNLLDALNPEFFNLQRKRVQRMSSIVFIFSFIIFIIIIMVFVFTFFRISRGGF